MTLVCPVDLDSIKLRHDVQEMYARVAATPDGACHFHRGPVYAVEWLGYDAIELRRYRTPSRTRSRASAILRTG